MFPEPPKNQELPASHVKASSLLDGLYPFTRHIAPAELCLRGFRTDCTSVPSLTVGYLGSCHEVGLWLTHLFHLMSSTWC